MKNRDIPTLGRVYAVMQEVVRNEERAEWERDRMKSITAHLSWTHGGGSRGGMEEAFARISECETRHEEAVRRYTQELRRAEKILSGIQSETMRAFVLMTYVERLPEDEVREALGIGAAGYKIARRCIEKAGSMAEVVWHEKYISG